MSDHSSSETTDRPAAEGNEALLPSKAIRGVLCVKCESLNTLEAEKCHRCASHLYVFCHRCGQKNPRVNSRCESCRGRLHRSAGTRLRARHNVKRLYIIGASLGILTIIFLLLWAADMLPFMKK